MAVNYSAHVVMNDGRNRHLACSARRLLCRDVAIGIAGYVPPSSGVRSGYDWGIAFD